LDAGFVRSAVSDLVRVSAVEELVDGDGLPAAGAEPTGAEAAHEGGTVLAALLKNYQLAAKGRDESFAAFAAGKIGILLESDYFWRSVINPVKGSAPMTNRDTEVGFAMIPAKAKGSGVGSQDLVSMSGGGGTFINPNTKYPQQAWDLMTFMYSPEAIKAALNGQARITARQDVNKEVLGKDPLLGLISQKILPLTRFRPGLAVYPQVSQALQQATADIVSGKSVADAAAGYQTAVEKVTGGADKVAKS